MTAKYFAILTNQGAARLANAAALGTKLNLTQMAGGYANGKMTTHDPVQTKIINQKRIAPLNLLTVDPTNTSQIIAEQIIPENEGGFWIREIGLYDDDGILIAVANCPETYKPLLAEGSGRTQTIRMILVVSSTSAITLKIDPSVVLATRKYVDDAVIEVKGYVDGLMRNHEQSRNHPDATTTAKGFTQLNSSVTDDRETQSATPKAVKIAMDNANARLAKERNLADLPNPALARQNLQLGDSSTKNTGTTTNTVAAGDDARITGAMQKSQNGADIQDVAKFLQNLGLSTVVQGDRCYLVGFASGEANQPYMTHFASQEVVKLATAESPTFTGTPLVPDALPGNYGQQAANTKFVHDKIAELVNSSPDTLDTLKELADALGNDAHFATTMANALAGKQPKDQVLTDLSGKTVGGILAYLGLKTAAQKDVGTGPNQIPDMGGFTASLGVSGWAKLPNGLIFQWGMAGQLTPQNPDAIGSFNITFPNKCLFITEHDQGNAARKSVIQIGYVTNTGFTMYNMGVLDRQIPSGLQAPVTVTVPWFAIGY